MSLYILETFSNELNFKGVNIWSDSMISLSWINSDKKLPVFVQNRVKEIVTTNPNAKFLHIPGEINPADLMTRGVSAKELLKNKNWWHGPDNLPSVFRNQVRFKEVLESLVTEDSSNNHCEKIVKISSLACHEADEFPIDTTKYSSYDKLLNVLCIVLRFVKIKIPKVKYQLCPKECRVGAENNTIANSKGVFPRCL